jgi:hypothetical protein
VQRSVEVGGLHDETHLDHWVGGHGHALTNHARAHFVPRCHVFSGAAGSR